MQKLNTSLYYWLLVALVGGFFVNVDSVRGQNGAEQRRGGRGKNLPQVGEKLPDVTVFDENGEPLKLRSIKGKYSVIVFGCLT